MRLRGWILSLIDIYDKKAERAEAIDEAKRQKDGETKDQ